MKIILAGGGTGGPATPLLAVASEIKKLEPTAEFLFVGTKNGPEQKLVEEAQIRFVSISSGKLRRYFSLQNFFDLFRILAGFLQAKKIIKEFKPDLVFSVGSFVAVPVCFAARKKAKIVIHQQDARIGLANKLVAPFADYITTTFQETTKEFYTGSGFEKNPKVRTEWVGNPVREAFLNNDTTGKEFFNLTTDLPVLLIFGGATGATQINEVVDGAIPELAKAHQVIHVTGKGKNTIEYRDPNYHPYEFLTKEMPIAMKIADIVVARAGLSTIAELSALGKVAIIVPMPDSHQEDNAAILKHTNSAVVLNSEEFNPETLARVIVSLKFNVKRVELLSNNIRNLMPHDSSKKLAEIIINQIRNG
jgi:UDP-N-acetylglucosamine--N-acetylmuramyl-(pentapeptide) pyrophosphoryl-undecaprenol N-acetylglucosamine transferase